MTEPTHNKPNRLKDETSPYLLDHAHNPVDWHAWGEEALEKSRALNRPIFLSIGYSACHWCHVMAHESFEDAETAALMNEFFVNIKVDREERPDLDQIYMNSVVAITGRGGWPMSVFLTPDQKPFYGGTYWPPEPRMGMPGFRDILKAVNQAWMQKNDDLVNQADALTRRLVQMGTTHHQPTPPTIELLQNAERTLLEAADMSNGGFGRAPKFPHPMDVRLLLRLHKRFHHDAALDVVRLTLNKMARGGIYDQLGGGFHRYSTDHKWLVPHFEKMLYDNALLASTYLEAFQVTADNDFSRIVRETLDYTLSEMTAPEGGFYSTQDADSEGVEGKFFVWSEEEIVQHLGRDEARIFSDAYDVTPQGNWEGNNILNRVKTHAQVAKMHGLDERELADILAGCRSKLFAVRSQRIAPARDEKILTSWNGLMIAAMAQAASVLNEPRYAEAARRAADFVLEHMQSNGHRLLHASTHGQPRFNAYLDDYACLIDSLVDLYSATFDVRYLNSALELAGQMIEHFYDARSAGFYYTSDDHESLIVRNKDGQDNATPSGNAVAAFALLKLGRICGRGDLEEKAVATLEFLSGQLAQSPMSGGQSLMAVDFLIGPTHEFAIVDGRHTNDTDRILSLLHSRFLPNKVVLKRPPGVNDESLPEAVHPVLAGKLSVSEEPTVYLCEHGACQTPVAGAEAFSAALMGG